MRLLALLLLTATASAQDPALPQEPTIYVVTASWCAPCQRFRRDWETVPGLARLVGTNYAVKKCDWDKPSEQRWARRMGVTQIPSYIVVHRHRVLCMWSGYAGDWQDWLRRVDLDEYIIDGMLVPSHPEREPGWQAPQTSRDPGASREAPQQPANPPVNLAPINDRLGNLEQLIRELSTRPEPRAPERPPEPRAPPSPPVVSQPVEQDAKPAGSLNGWGAVMDAAVQLGLIAAAPQVALPAGALGVAGFLFRAWRNRTGTSKPEPRQIVRQETVREVPVVVATDVPPAPQQIVTTNQYVPVDVNTHADAYAWATAELVKKYSGAEGTVAMLDNLIAQHKAAHGGKDGNK